MLSMDSLANDLDDLLSARRESIDTVEYGSILYCQQTVFQETHIDIPGLGTPYLDTAAEYSWRILFKQFFHNLPRPFSGSRIYLCVRHRSLTGIFSCEGPSEKQRIHSVVQIS